ncbi:hypothetical protein G9A89_022508 [Geosiphon pyriformis]|nr:hypothetical protein G9A89_022508 [Geosiphon pyriformis]
MPVSLVQSKGRISSDESNSSTSQPTNSSDIGSQHQSLIQRDFAIIVSKGPPNPSTSCGDGSELRPRLTEVSNSHFWRKVGRCTLLSCVLVEELRLPTTEVQLFWMYAFELT